MNDRQRTALENHCRFAFETCQPRFAYLDRSCRASVVLTVNSGYE
jgi:hypothetical protein